MFEKQLSLGKKELVPPGGWRHYVPETRYRVKAKTYALLHRATYLHMKANGVEFPGGEDNFDTWFEDHLCRELGIECTHCGQTSDPKEAESLRRITPADAKNFLNTVLAHLANGGTIVAQEEANRRAKICAGCPLNKRTRGCFGCEGIDALIQKITRTADVTTEYDEELGDCSACGCRLASKVWLPLHVLQKTPSPNPYWSECWMLEE